MPETIAGKYTLLRKLAVGGMAEVHLARQHGMGGFAKLVVIKRILSDLARQPKFVKMFLDEARTAATLTHTNVVDIYEVGEHEGMFFIAMEYLRGQNLRRLWKEAARQKTAIPWGQSVQIVLDAARGLHHAHTQTDLEGNPLGLVHRDVSPHNVIVTYDGHTKVVDFGIAKASQTTTEPGVIRGKLEYMSPEQISGFEVTAASDQFSLGILLWELTTGRRLFRRDRPSEIMRAVVDDEIPPPASVLENFSPRLEAIVLRTLSPDRTTRFADCGALADALDEFLIREGIQHSPARVGQMMHALFETEMAQEARTNALLVRSVSEPGHAIIDADPEFPTPSGTDHMSESTRGTKTNLVDIASEFIGRSDDLHAVHSALDESRLVTLWGPAGTGKTRMALEFGRSLIEEMPGGVWFCDLTQANSADTICSALGAVLGVPLTATAGSGGVERLGYAIASRGQALFLLDNFEHLVQVAPETLGVWLRMAPETRFLVTSREPLKIGGEHAHEVAVLPEADAVELFMSRARALRGNLELDGEDLVAVATIVEQLDYMPLAIELAARRMNVFTPSQLLSRLGQRFQLLTGGDRAASPRQATLRGAIDWSWELLDAAEQSALAQCSVFAGGFDLDAAEAVLDVSEHTDTPVLDIVQALREKSLVRAYESVMAEVRFGLFQSIHVYANEKLASLPEAPRSLARHAAYYIRRAERWASTLDQRGGIRSLIRLNVERENLLEVHRQALDGPPTREAIRTALRAVLAIEPLLSLQGPLRLLDSYLEAALSQAAAVGVENAFRARGHLARAVLRQRLGRPEDADSDFEEAFALAEDEVLVGRIHRAWGILQRDRGDNEGAEGRYRRALAIAETVGDAEGRGRALNSLGRLAMNRNRPDEAREFFERSLAILGEVGARRHEGRTLANLGGLAMNQAERQAAREYYEQALAIHREFNDRRFEAIALGNLGILQQDSGFLDDARMTYEAALMISRQIGDLFSEGAIVGYIGTLHHEEGRLAQARSYYEGAIRALVNSGDPIYEALFRSCLGAACAAQDDVEEAETCFAAAAKVLEDSGYHYFEQTLDIHHGHLLLAKARVAEEDGDDVGAAELRRVAASRASLSPDSAPSEDVRIALRLLSAAAEPGSLNVGEVALVFTDVEGSTALWDVLTDAMREALDLHNAVVREVLASHEGYEVKNEGDAFMLAFHSTFRAVSWCLEVQARLMDLSWPEPLLTHPCAAAVGGFRGLRVRMGVHAGRPERRPDPVTGRMDYFGPMVNRSARIVQAAHGGQVLVSARVWQEIAGRLDQLGDPVAIDLGEHRLRGLASMERLVQLLPIPAAKRSFPPPDTVT